MAEPSTSTESITIPARESVPEILAMTAPQGGSTTVNGGTISITGGSSFAGIGGQSTDEYQIKISGGEVTAEAYDMAGNSVGNAIGMGQLGSGAPETAKPVVTLNGAAVIASSMQEDAVLQSGILFEGNENGDIYGDDVTLQENFTIPEGKTMVIGAG